MKKIYIAPKIDVIILDSLCNGGIQTASVLTQLAAFRRITF